MTEKELLRKRLINIRAQRATAAREALEEAEANHVEPEPVEPELALAFRAQKAAEQERRDRYAAELSGE